MQNKDASISGPKFKTDFIIIGCGIIGINIAADLRKRFPRSKISIIEKEKVPAFHSTGRNSGVLHAGFYYTADTLKAKFTAEGNHFYTDYCKTMGLPINPCGKLVVARNENEVQQFKILLSRAKSNGVALNRVSLSEALKLEPRLNSKFDCLWSPKTSTVDPVAITHSLLKELAKANVETYWDTKFVNKASHNQIQTTRGTFQFEMLINTAGLYADVVAKNFGFAKDLRVLPFKGLYLYASKDAPIFRRHIYPVPNLNNPFLGVHHTQTVDGYSKIGPTAIPAFWREQYKGFERFQLKEFLQIMGDEMSLFFKSDFDFRRLALEEIKKYSRRVLLRESAELATAIHPQHYIKWGQPGIRAQLFDTKQKKLVMDFCIEGAGNNFHVLNAISPAFTCSKPFAQYFVSKMLNESSQVKN